MGINPGNVVTHGLVGCEVGLELVEKGHDVMVVEMLERLVNDTKRWPLMVDKKAFGFEAGKKINELMVMFVKKHKAELGNRSRITKHNIRLVTL